MREGIQLGENYFAPMDENMFEEGMYDEGMYDEGMYDEGMYDEGLKDTVKGAIKKTGDAIKATVGTGGKFDDWYDKKSKQASQIAEPGAASSAVAVSEEGMYNEEMDEMYMDEEMDEMYSFEEEEDESYMPEMDSLMEGEKDDEEDYEEDEEDEEDNEE